MGLSKQEVKVIGNRWAIVEWQDRWDKTDKGRVTYRWFPSIRDRMRMKWLSVNHYLSQLLSEHGDFNGNLYRLGLVDRPGCDCGHEPEDVWYILEECRYYDAERCALRSEMNTLGVNWDEFVSDWMSGPEMVPLLSKFAEDVLRGKRIRANELIGQ